MSTIVDPNYITPDDVARQPIDMGPPKSYRELVVRMADGEDVPGDEMKIVLQGASRRKFMLQIDVQRLLDRRRWLADVRRPGGNEHSYWQLIGSGDPRARQAFVQLGLATGILGRQLFDLQNKYSNLADAIAVAEHAAKIWEQRLESVLDGEPAVVGAAPWYRQSTNPLRRSDPQEPDGRSIKTIVAERRVVLEKSERRLGELTAVRDRIQQLKEQMADLRRQQQPVLKRLQIAENMSFTD